MTCRVGLLALALASFAQAPQATPLDDHEKVELFEKVGNLNKIFGEAQKEQQEIQNRLKMAQDDFEGLVAKVRKRHNAVGCVLDYATMKWGTCTKEDKK